jgi:tetratricopeptide (TPR) repeat protein
VCLAGRAVDWDHEQLKAWAILRNFNPHLVVCATSFLQLDLSSIRFNKKTLDIPQAIESVGYALYSADHAEEACKLFQLNCKLSEDMLGKSHPLTFATTDYLASALEAAGKLHEAEVTRRQLVEDSRRALGENSDDVFTYWHNLGKLLVDEEKYLDAEPILEKVLKFRQKHSTLVSTIAPAMNLGVVYMELHQFKAAETIFTAAKELMNNETDENLSLRLQTMGWLGYLKSELGRRDECEALNIEAVELAKSRCGLEDPLTLLWHKNLLDFYAEDIATMDEERRELMVSVGKYLISTWPNIKGSSDRNRCKIQMCLGNLFYALGDLHASKDYYQGILATVSLQDSTEMSIGDQTFMAQAYGGLGMCHWDRGLVAQAIQYWTVAHELYGILAQERKSHIQDFHDTKSNIAIGLRDSHEYLAAEALFKEALAVESTVSNYATSILTKNNLATIYHLQARHSEALEIFENSLAAVPPEDEQLPHVLLVKHSLACLHESMCNLDEAISLLESTLSFKELKLGIRSPATLKTAITLGRMYRKREDNVKAMELADRIMPYLDYA